MYQDTLVSNLKSLQHNCHLALIYDTFEEQMAAVIPFIQIGLEQGEYCVYAADENPIEDILTQMNNYGIDTELQISKGALAVLGKKDVYLRQKVFDPDEMIRFLDMVRKTAEAAGFEGFRGTGEMSWALNTNEGLERLIDYETKLDRNIDAMPMNLICQYNVNRFPPDVLLNVIKTHPQLLYQSKLCDNAFYIPPDQSWTGDPLKQELDQKLKLLQAL